MSDKTLTDAELELTQRLQLHFPRGIDPGIVQEWNGFRKETVTEHLGQLLRNRGQMQVITTSGIIAPPSGIVWPLTVPVNESRDWKEVIKAAGPNTDRGSDIWKVGNQFPPIAGAIERLQQIWLVNFGKDSRTSSQGVISWGKEQHLILASSRANFAIAEHFPKLNTYLGMNSMAVVSLRECSLEGGSRGSGVWFLGSERDADLPWFEGDWGGACWFAFVREFGPRILGC